MSDSLKLPSGCSSYLFYQDLQPLIDQYQEEAWPGDLSDAVKKEENLRQVSAVATLLIAIAAMTVGGLYLGKVISTATMVPLAATLGSSYYLFSTRVQQFIFPNLCLAMVTVALAILVSEKILDPAVLTPLTLGIPLTLVVSSCIPAAKTNNEKCMMINTVFITVFYAALASLLLFTNYLSTEGAAAIYFGGCFLSAMLSTRGSEFKHILPTLLISATVAALVFFHILPYQYLIGLSILAFSEMFAVHFYNFARVLLERS